MFTAGACIQWLRDGLQAISNAAETEIWPNVADNGGVYFVPPSAASVPPTGI
jgi:glycerol kinase